MVPPDFKKTAFAAVSALALSLALSPLTYSGAAAAAAPVRLTNMGTEEDVPQAADSASDELDALGAAMDVPVVPAVPPARGMNANNKLVMPPTIPDLPPANAATNPQENGTPAQAKGSRDPRADIVARGSVPALSLPTSAWEVKQSTLPTGFYEAGKPAPCVATRRQQGNGLIQIAASARKLYALTFEAEELGLGLSDVLSLTLVIDRDPAPLKLTASAMTPQTLMVNMPDPTAMYARLEKAERLTLLVQKPNGTVQQLRYDLSGIRTTFAEMDKCFATTGRKLAALGRPANFAAVPGGDKIIPGRARRAQAAEEGRAVPPPIWPDEKNPPNEQAPVAALSSASASPAVIAWAASPMPKAEGQSGSQSEVDQRLAAIRAENERLRAEMAQIKQAVAEVEKRAAAPTAVSAASMVASVPVPVPVPAGSVPPHVPAVVPTPIQEAGQGKAKEITWSKAAPTSGTVAVEPKPPRADRMQLTVKGPPAPETLEREEVRVLAPRAIEGAAAPTAAIPILPSESYRARQGEHLRDVLRRWADREGIDLVWDMHSDVVIKKEFSSVGNFDSAVRQLLAAYPEAGIKTILAPEGMGIDHKPYIEEAGPPAAPAAPMVAAGPALDDFAPASPPVPVQVDPLQGRGAMTGVGATTTAPSSPAASVAVPAAEPAPVGPVKRWRALQGASMRQVMEAWAEEAQVNLLWLARHDFAVRHSVTETADYGRAVRNLLGQYSFEPVRPVGQLYQDPKTGEKTLVVR